MKKLKIFLSLLSFISIIILAGCKSTPAGTTVNPLSIIDEGHSFYIAIPKTADPELLNNVIKNNINGLSEKNISQLAGYLNKVYAGIDFTRNGTSIQAAIESTFPRKYASNVLTKKNGWEKNQLKIDCGFSQCTVDKYDVYNQEPINLAFPADHIICLADSKESIKSLIQNYDYNAFYESTADHSSENYNSYYQMPDDIYNWIKYSDNAIKFYTTSPKIIVSQIIGTNIDLSLETIKGTITQSTDSNNLYSMDCVFKFLSPKSMKAGKAILTIGFQLDKSDIEVISDREFEIKGIQIKKDRIYKLLEL